MRRGLAVAAIVAVVALADPQGRAEAPDEQRAVWAEACQTYESRARFLSHQADFSLPVLLAEACRGALGSLASDRGPERHAAQRFLLRLTRFRDTIAEMTLRRAYGAGADAQSGAMGRIATVSATGEYLIAREMGVLAALDQWLGTGPPVSLAAR